MEEEDEAGSLGCCNVSLSHDASIVQSRRSWMKEALVLAKSCLLVMLPF
jgi:hypothetical protein